jgi:hypothetical protein
MWYKMNHSKCKEYREARRARHVVHAQRSDTKKEDERRQRTISQTQTELVDD